MYSSQSTRWAWVFLFLLAVTPVASASTIQIQSIEGYLHYGASPAPQEMFLMSSPAFTSALGSNNLGSFYFDWMNLTGGSISGLKFTLFVDLDIDRDGNTFFNEYGELVSLDPPVLSPSDAIAASQWEIDEPGYTYGDIYNHVYDGVLDGLNGVPSSAPDDVSQALQFQIPNIADGQSVRFYGSLSSSDAAGLGQFDPDSNVSVYVNGYALLGPAPNPNPNPNPSTEVPEPQTFGLFTAGAAVLALVRYRSSK